MPYGTRKSGKMTQVFNKETGKVYGTHSSKKKANKQLAALHIHTDEAKHCSSMSEAVLSHQEIADDNELSYVYARAMERFGPGARLIRSKSGQLMVDSGYTLYRVGEGGFGTVQFFPAHIQRAPSVKEMFGVDERKITHDEMIASDDYFLIAKTFSQLAGGGLRPSDVELIKGDDGEVYVRSEGELWRARQIGDRFGFERAHLQSVPKMEDVFKEGLPSGTKNVTLNQIKTDMKKNMDAAIKNIGNVAQKGDVQIKQTPPKPNDPKNLTGGYAVVDTAGNVSKLDPTTGQLQTDPSAGSMNTPFSPSSMTPGSQNR
jgi:hypothetical protein